MCNYVSNICSECRELLKKQNCNEFLAKVEEIDFDKDISSLVYEIGGILHAQYYGVIPKEILVHIPNTKLRYKYRVPWILLKAKITKLNNMQSTFIAKYDKVPELFETVFWINRAIEEINKR